MSEIPTYSNECRHGLAEDQCGACESESLIADLNVARERAEKAEAEMADWKGANRVLTERILEVTGAMSRLVDGHGADEECIRISRDEWYRFRRVLDPSFVGAYERPMPSVSTGRPCIGDVHKFGGVGPCDCGEYDTPLKAKAYSCPSGRYNEDFDRGGPRSSEPTLNPGDQVRLIAAPVCGGVVDGWVSAALVRVAWYAGLRTEVAAASLERWPGDSSRTERFERAKAAWKEITGEDVSSLCAPPEQWTNEAPPCVAPPVVTDLGCWVCRVLADAVKANAVDVAMYEGMIVGARVALGAPPVLCREHAERWSRVGVDAGLQTTATEAHAQRLDKPMVTVEKQPAVVRHDGRYHYLKTWPFPFEDVRAGSKPFEYRRFDRDYRVDDVLVLQKFEPNDQRMLGPVECRRVTYLLPGGTFGVPEGYCVMGIAPLDAARTDYPLVKEIRWLLQSALDTAAMSNSPAWQDLARNVLKALDDRRSDSATPLHRDVKPENAPDRGRLIAEHSHLSMYLTQLRAELPELEKTARKTPRRDMLDERAKVEHAKARVEPTRKHIAWLEKDVATRHEQLVQLGAYGPAKTVCAHCGETDCKDLHPSADVVEEAQRSETARDKP